MPGCEAIVCHSDGRVEGGEKGGVLVLHQLKQSIVENLPSVHQVFAGQLSSSRCLGKDSALK